MIKVISVILAILMGMSLIIFSFCIAFEVAAFNESNFEKSYIENDLHDLIGIKSGELTYVTIEMLAYLKNGRDDLSMYANIRGEFQEVFGEKEVLHMVDVLELFKIGYLIRFLAVVLYIILFVVMFLLHGRIHWRHLGFGFLWALGITFILGLSAGIWMAIDFNGMFIKFHETFFTNDMWLLNINTDVLIQMLPESFFNKIALNVLLYTAGILALPSIISLFSVINTKKKKISING